MRGLLFVVGLLAGLSVIDQIACRGQYSHAAWLETREKANYFGHQVAYWVDGIMPL
jgi:hypothetical protein